MKSENVAHSNLTLWAFCILYYEQREMV